MNTKTMNSKSTPIQGTPLDQVLKQTELGSFIARYKFVFIGLVALAIAAAFGFGLYKMQMAKTENKLAQDIHLFTTTALQDFQNKKLAPEAFFTQLNSLKTKVGSFTGMVPTLLVSSDELVKQGENEKALNVLDQMATTYSDPYISYFVFIRQAAVLEDLGQIDRAIEVLEKLNSSSVKLLEGKVYLDLGRLYKEKGNKEKAKLNLEYVVNNISQAEFTRLAKIYLAELE